MKLVVTATLAAALLAPSAAAQSLEELKTADQLNETLELLDKAEAILKSTSRTRRSDCMKAVGNAAFCGCIGDKLAVAWSFSDYVAITTRSKEENGYASLDPNMRVAYDNVAAVRDECVASPAAP
ncbi:hypothetical protein ACFPOA_15825 [Lysobacter niabensis]|uniref:hypothetical protein n=1 Tax=Agrilutibacter niabensis TaxID=380628 RepID=UPI003621DE18